VTSLLQADARLSERLRDAAAGRWARRCVVVLARSGDACWWLSAAAACLLGRGASRSRGAAVAVAVTLAAAVVGALKALVRRRRPSPAWRAAYRGVDRHGFPSGHAARVSALAVLGVTLGPPWLGWLACTWAAAAAVARVAVGAHQLSDVVAGALLGIGCGALVARWLPLLTG
jgi:membrane-associated phospholipid phosphatase